MKLNKGDYVVFYSDGMAPLIYSKRFNIVKKFNNLEGYIEKQADKISGSEGTLVVVKLSS